MGLFVLTYIKYLENNSQRVMHLRLRERIRNPIDVTIVWNVERVNYDRLQIDLMQIMYAKNKGISKSLPFKEIKTSIPKLRTYGAITDLTLTRSV